MEFIASTPGDSMKTHLPDNHALSDFILGIRALFPKINDEPSITDAQYCALEAGVARGESVLISAPTSTGKTLIGWWTAASSLCSGGRAVYLVSHRTLAKQKFDEAQHLFLNKFLDGDRSSIVCATGDAVEDASGRKTNSPLSASILIATYEKYLGCLSTGGPPRDLSDVTFICDEIQLIGEKNRGKNVELLLTLLKRSGWKQFVGLSAVLSPEDSSAIADWLNLRLVRGVPREKAIRISCRTPTATHSMFAAPNRDGDWVTGTKEAVRDTISIVEGQLLDGSQKPVIVFCMKVDDTFELAGQLAARRPVRPLSRAPGGVDIDPVLADLMDRRVAFHNAELSEEERAAVESNLASGDVDVVFATSTLAAGVNFPLGSAVFSTWKRWDRDKKKHLPIGRAEFQNMAGRVGRMGQAAAEGRVIIVSNDGTDLADARKLIDLTDHDVLGDGISPEDFGPLVLQIFAGKLCFSRDEAFSLLSSTLSAERELNRNTSGLNTWRHKLDYEIERLIATGCLIEGRSKIVVTTLGLAVARSGLKPETALYFFDGLYDFAENLTAMLPNGQSGGSEDDLTFILSHAALASPEFNLSGGPATRHISWRVGNPGIVTNPYAARLSKLLFEQPWMADVAAINGALILTKWAKGDSKSSVESAVPSVRLGITQNLARDAAWILNGVADVIVAVTARSLAEESKPEKLRGSNSKIASIRQLARAMRRQATRISAGLPSDTLWMTSLDLQGPNRRLNRTQILALKSADLVRPLDLMNGDPLADQKRRDALDGGTGNRLSNLVRDAAKQWKISDREYWKARQLKRAKRFNAESIIEDMYQKRGTDFERAFENALNFAAISFTPLDEKGKTGYPDYLVSIELFPELVFELKTKQKDEHVVSFNDAVEVLAASELIKRRDNFCVTLCNPAFEPSLPSLIEACGRLCVVDVCDFVEALLQIKEGLLTRNDFYDWITTPGVALKEDIASSVIQ